MAIDSFLTHSGEVFKADTMALSRFLARYGLRGAELGFIIRGEEPIPPQFSREMLESEAGAKFKSPRAPKGPKGPNIEKLWDALTAAVRASAIDAGPGWDAGELFLQSGVEPDEFLSWLQTASADMAQSWEYSLNPNAEDLWVKFLTALKTGIYTKTSPYERWSLRERLGTLKEIFADHWYDEVSKGWELIRRNPKRMRELLALSNQNF